MTGTKIEQRHIYSFTFQPLLYVIYNMISILTWAIFILWKSYNCRTNLPSRTQLPYLGCQLYLAVSSHNQDSVAPKCLMLSAVSFIKEVQETIVESQPSRVQSHFSMRQKSSQQTLKIPLISPSAQPMCQLAGRDLQFLL